MPVPIYYWKDLSIDFVMELLISTNWKGDSYDSILVIVDWLIKIVHYKSMKITIKTFNFLKVIWDMVMQQHDVVNSFVSNWSLVFTLKFYSSLYYFLKIKQRLYTTFYPQTNGQTKKWNNTIETYLKAFVNYKQND